jgi:hypothetical protein
MTTLERKSKVSRSAGADGHDQLPYRIELWDAERHGVERLLERGGERQPGAGDFFAAEKEHVERSITLRHGTRVIAKTK